MRGTERLQYHPSLVVKQIPDGPHHRRPSRQELDVLLQREAAPEALPLVDRLNKVPWSELRLHSLRKTRISKLIEPTKKLKALWAALSMRQLTPRQARPKALLGDLGFDLQGVHRQLLVPQLNTPRRPDFVSSLEQVQRKIVKTAYDRRWSFKAGHWRQAPTPLLRP